MGKVKQITFKEIEDHLNSLFILRKLSNDNLYIVSENKNILMGNLEYSVEIISNSFDNLKIIFNAKSNNITAELEISKNKPSNIIQYLQVSQKISFHNTTATKHKVSFDCFGDLLVWLENIISNN